MAPFRPAGSFVILTLDAQPAEVDDDVGLHGFMAQATILTPGRTDEMATVQPALNWLWCDWWLFHPSIGGS